MTTTETLIIGAGLTGLTIAYELHKAGKPFLLLEARDRTGGRILTSRTDDGAPVEIGATWLGKKHEDLIGLLSELGIGTFEQVTGGRAIYEASSLSPAQVVQLPHNDEPSYRIAGGSEMLIRELWSKVPSASVRLDEPVLALKGMTDYVEVTTSQGVYQAGKVVSTLPPYLFTSKVTVSPALPDQLLSTARQTHTWMGESIKVGLRYAKPFWREDGGPGGTIFSNVGPVSEMYDHTNIEENKYALKGFLNGMYHSVSREERRDMVLTQLRKYYGEVVDDYLAYEEGVWRQELYTFADYDGHVLPHQNNGHPVFREEYLDGRLLLAGAETAVLYPGYMDGAVRSARRVAGLVL
ncbi:MAG: NAD(P)/FAD-dependent oxidoreductase [Lewinella sp.]|nr:NAD(P)/FAD-dependent oxidoreductase [Lewinella sp.]